MECVKEGGGKGEGRGASGSFLPLSYPHRFFFFGSRPIFRAGKIPKTPFLGLSLFPNPTETLATQARGKIRKTPDEALLLSHSNYCTSNNW